MNKIRVIKEHLQTKELFPLGFETTYETTYTKEDKISEGFHTHIRTMKKDTTNKKTVFFEERVYVEPKIIPKGTLEDIIIISAKGTEVSSDFFYRATGRSFTEFVEKI